MSRVRPLRVGPKGLPPPTSPDDSDPMSGREWDTQGSDLQYACTFALPQAKDCADPRFAGECDCNTTPPVPPLCDKTTTSLQIRGKAYPGIRQLTLVRDLGPQGIAASLCPRSLDTSSPDFGYRPAVRALIVRTADWLDDSPPAVQHGACTHRGPMG